jgi:PAS domain S-box-containing protein
MRSTTDAAIFVTDSSGAVIGANRELERITGHRAQQILGGPWGALLADDVPLGLRRLINARLDRVSYTGAYVRFRDAGPQGPWRLLVEVEASGTRVCVATPAAQDRATDRLGGVYAEAAAAEQAATETGAALDTAARIGAEAITQGLVKLGFGTYDDLLRAAVPAETAALEALPEAPTDPALTSVWSSAVGVDRHLERQQVAYAKLMEISSLLINASGELLDQLEPMEEAALQIMAAARGLPGSATPLTAAHRARTSVEQTGIRFRTLSLGVGRSHELVST